MYSGVWPPIHNYFGVWSGKAGGLHLFMNSESILGSGHGSESILGSAFILGTVLISGSEV